jgi:class 3 adenylate cyclase/tetratricopeptide (TPR) repeat protein
MKCAKCGAENREGAKFCNECAAPIEASCPKCGAKNKPGAKFCDECGTSLVPSAAASPKNPNDSSIRVIDLAVAENLEGERKTVTMLFADIKGSMDLMEDLDPEEARAIVDPALKLMMEAVQRYGGYVAQPTGDGIFALFGAPIAHEDHPQRALLAGLRMQEELKRYSDRIRAEGGLPIQARVGVNTGEVVVRSIPTGEGRSEYAPVGHSTGIAARMQALAPVGSIAATEQVRKLCEGYFLFKSLGPTKVKGVSDPVNVYEVTGLGPLRTRLQRGAAGGYTKFVGRKREMETLKHAAELAQAGHGQIVASVAEPGVGKSRLFFEFKATSRSGWLVLEALSFSHGKTTAYLPLVELLHDYFGIGPEDEPRRRREKVAGKVTMLDRSLEENLPHLFALLGIVEVDPLANMDEPSQSRRRRTQEAVKRILLRESLNQPLMLIFEDLHWIDDETQAFLNLLAEGIANAPLLLLVNYRPEYTHQWNSKTYYTQLRLDPLGGGGADEMLTALLGSDASLAPLKRLIAEKTEGNPLFMEEIYLSLLEDGALTREGGVKLTRPLASLRIPSSVQGIIHSRVDRLPTDEKALLQTVAVLGMDFELGVARALSGRPDDELNRMLTHLQLAEFVYEQPGAGDVEYSFKHVLTQEVAYNSILIERRKALHEQTGEAIEQLFADRLDDYVTDLAYHYRRSTNVPKTIQYLERVARKALEQAAHLEVVGCVTQALELIKQLPDGADPARLELQLQMTLSASLLLAVGPGSPEREKALVRALELCEQLDDSRMAEVMLSLGFMRGARAELLVALQLFNKAYASAEQANDTDGLAAAHGGIGYSLFLLGRWEKAREHFESAIELSGGRPIGKYGQSSLATQAVPFLLASTLLTLGYPVAALKTSDKALGTARQSSNPFFAAAALGGCLLTHLLLRDIRPVAERVEELAALAAEHEISIFHAVAIFCRGWLAADAGRIKEGVAEMEGGIRQSGAWPPTQTLILALAEVSGRNGLPEKGLAAVEQGLARSEKTPTWQSEFYRLKGELSLLKDPGTKEEAEDYLRQAIEVARRQAARLFELRATTSLARLLRDTDRRDEARSMLADIYNWFTEGFDIADLKDARALLVELSE